ncbi:hypothetical protein N0V83_002580 [Neocucurbitaria cava]|uniref:Vacuolar ATPase assembly protein VMA22 n=1 Tax=Neocucurbitaria cava TaxID=798079 RepID=A0A9W8YCC5_9PLEO|nr:hypothetical protein N0V83_002580 [Neocucurbitaria cava]
MADVQNNLPVISDASREHFRSQRPEKDALITQLDELLERYLNTLDEHEKIRQDLSKQLSSANFHNSSSAIRYGQDCYDERMQAIRKVNVEEPDSGLEVPVRFSTFSVSESRDDIKSKENSAKDEERHENEKDGAAVDEQQPPNTSKTESSAPEETSTAGDDSREESKTAKETTKDANKIADPLRWFGILVPPALRTAQSAFISAVEGPIPQLATIARDLRSQEIEIGRVRKQIKKL